MDVVSACPLRVASIVWQPRPDAFVLTVVCKATYTLLPLDSPLASEQEQPNDADTYWDDDPQRSLQSASDLSPFKRRADILLVGHAHAPKAKPVASLTARFVVGDLTKAVEVHADRAWTADGRLQEEAPFVRMPLRWERAAGGPGTANPVGVSASAPPSAHGLRAIPNLQPPGFRVASPADLVPPIGFGPLAPMWPGRVEKLHRYAAFWNPGTWNQRPLPEDVDGAFFNAAPLDQQVDQIRGGERIVLENLLLAFPRLTTTLSAVTPRAVAQRSSGEQELRLRCDTLVIDTDAGTCSLVWRAALPLQHPEERGQVVVSAEGEALKRFSENSGATMMVSTAEFAALGAGPVLPFVKDAVVRAPGSGREGTGGEGVTAKAAPAAVPPRSVPRDDMSGTITSYGPPPRDPLPFARSGAGPAPSAPPSSPQSAGSGGFAAGPEPAQVPAPAKPALMGMLGPDALDPSKREALLVNPLQPPPMMSIPVETPEEPPEEPVIAPPPEGASLFSKADDAEPAIDVTQFSIERYAAISAEIAEQRASRADVLKSHELTSRSWTSLERHFMGVLEKEAERGANELRGASDKSYVATVEGFRGPITLPEYARILVGLERGQANQALDELKIQRPALMPILRVWTKKLSGDMRLAGEVIAAVSAARNQLG